MDVLDPEEKLICPYNPAHHIMRKRMNTHLVKCKKNYPASKLVACDFNITHKIPEPELQYHHENCPDKREVEPVVYQGEGVVINKFPVHNVEVPQEESWDNMNMKSYDPEKHCSTSEVLRHVDVAPPSSRKNFRASERARLNQITNAKTEQSKVGPPGMDKNRPVSRRNLPEASSSTVQEDTPNSVAHLMERIKLGKDKAFIPKQK